MMLSSLLSNNESVIWNASNILYNILLHGTLNLVFFNNNFSVISTMTDILQKYCKWTFFVQFNTLQKQTNNSRIV